MTDRLAGPVEGVFRGGFAHRLLMLVLLLAALLPLPLDRLAFIPAYAFGIAGLEAPLDIRAALLGLAGHFWVHSGLWHLLANVSIFAVIGPPVAACLGGRRYWALFVLTALLAALGEGLISEDRMAPMVGASGGIAGLIGAMIGHWRRVWLDIPLPWRGWAVPIPLSTLIWLELLANILLAALSMSELAPLDDFQVAWGAHLFGFVAGWLVFRWWHPEPPGERRLRLRAGFGFYSGDQAGNRAGYRAGNMLTAALWGATVLNILKG